MFIKVKSYIALKLYPKTETSNNLTNAGFIYIHGLNYKVIKQIYIYIYTAVV